MPTGYKVALALGLVAVLGILGYIAFDTESGPTDNNPEGTDTAHQPLVPINDGQPGMMTDVDRVTDADRTSNITDHSRNFTEDSGGEFGHGYGTRHDENRFDSTTDNVYDENHDTTSRGGNTYVQPERFGMDDTRSDRIEGTDTTTTDITRADTTDTSADPTRPGYFEDNTTDNNTTTTEGTVYIVKSDDRLWDISKAHYGTGVNWKAIVKANPGLDPQRMRAGMKIILPDIQSTSVRRVARTETTPVTNIPAGTKLVKVQSGETLSDIALREYGRSADYHLILKANPGVNPMKLYIGQTLRIPKKARGTTARVSHPTPRSGYKYYTVGKNETYYDIADSLYGDYSKYRLIKEANPNVDERRLRVGMKILVPDM